MTSGRRRLPASRIVAAGAMAVMLPARAAEAPMPEADASGLPVYGQPATTPSQQRQPATVAEAPTASQRRGWFVVPSFSLLETYTDNVGLKPGSGKESDLVTSLNPQLRVIGDTARLKLNLDYRRQQLFYANESRNNSGLNFLNATGRFEAVENRVFIEGGGHITQSAISAFGAQPTSTENVNGNRAEVRSFYLSPYVRGRFGSTADYEARYRGTDTHASSNSLVNATVHDWTAMLKSSNELATIGWRFDAQKQSSEFDTRRTLDLSRIRASLLYRYQRELTFSLLGGYETNNYASASQEGRATYGIGVDWLPGPRTSAHGSAERGFFGDNHEVRLTHRTPLSSWELLDSRVVTILPNQLAQAPVGTAYDLLFNALASRIPDPIQRAQAVDRQLQLSGIPRDLGLVNSFLTNAAYVQRTHQASVALLGVRNTITFTAALGRREGITTVGGASGDFATANVIDTRTISANWAHKLSAISSVNLLLSHFNNKGTSGTTVESTQNLARVLLTHQLSPRTTATLGVRYVNFTTTTGSGYTERAVTASIATTF
ncbi:MAG TPA: TIGR03016 family PEP-CTERM system-associated outer membrane protein [Burkholderiales bacterium]|nr:TIGR03016 family PEP-CTERM system-associated outer membrane protein [Burkholderiales bacterium]